MVIYVTKNELDSGFFQDATILNTLTYPYNPFMTHEGPINIKASFNSVLDFQSI